MMPIVNILSVVVLIQLLSSFRGLVEADITCGQDTSIDVDATLKYKETIYAFAQKMVAKVIGFRNGLPVLEVDHPVKADTLWPDLPEIGAAFAKDSVVYFFITTNVNIYEDFRFKKKMKIQELFKCLKETTASKREKWKFIRIMALEWIKSRTEETFLTLLPLQFKCKTWKSLEKCQETMHYIQQLYLYEDFREELRLNITIPKTIDKDIRESYLFSPNTLLTLGFEGETNKMITFYGPIWSPTDFSMDQGKKYFDFDPKVNYKLSGHWMGCPQVFCWEADVDAVTKLDDGSLLIFRGAYYLILQQWPPISLPPAPKKIVEILPQTAGHLDAALTVKGVTYLFKDKTVYRMASSATDKGKNRRELFKGSLKGVLDAAFLYQQTAADDIAYLFQDSYVFTYSVSNDHFIFQRKQGLTLFKGLPKNIDGAYSPGDQLLVAFKGSFYYKAKREEMFQPILSQKKAICGDAFYSTISWKIKQFLNITSFETFATYRLQFKPIPFVVTPEPSVTPMTPTAFDKYLWYLLFAILLLSVILALLCFAVFKLRKSGKSAPNAYPMGSIDANSSLSVSTIGSKSQTMPSKESKAE